MDKPWQMIETSGIQTSIDTTAGQVPAAAWSPGGRPGALYGSADWFQLAEALGTELRYIVARQAGDDLALAVLPVPGAPSRPGGSYDLVAHLLLPALGHEPGPALWQRYLVGGSWNSNLARLPVVHSHQVEVRRAVLSALLCTLERVAQEKQVPGICWPFLLTETAEELAALVGDCGFFLRTAPTTWMRFHGQSFEELLASFSRKERQNIRRELRIFGAESGAVQRVAPGEIADEFADLVVQNRVRHGACGEREKIRAMLTAQVQVFGERVLTFCTRQQGQLIAAINLIDSHGGLYARSFGCTHASEVRHMEYFTLGYYEPFRYCLERGLQWYHAGPQAYEAKVRRGLQLIPLWTLFLPQEPPTARQMAAVLRWNDAVREQWRDWFAATTGDPLPQSWRALHTGAS